MYTVIDLSAKSIVSYDIINCLPNYYELYWTIYETTLCFYHFKNRIFKFKTRPVYFQNDTI